MGVNFGFDGRVFVCINSHSSRIPRGKSWIKKNNANNSAKSLLARAGLVKAYAYC